MLTVRNIALIEEAVIEFHHGMHALTGETGAGKSIVVDAVNLLLGSRSDRGLIRSGCEKASVEGIFQIRNHPEISRLMEQENIDYDGETIVLYREISNSGKNLCRVCGVVTTLTVLKELAGLMMDLHGQSDNRFLTDSALHLPFLDQTGDDEHRRKMTDVEEKCTAFLKKHREYVRLVKMADKKEIRLPEIQNNLDELKKIDLKDRDIDSLRLECTRLERAETHAAGLREAYQNLTGNEGGNAGLSLIRSAGSQLLAFDDDQEANALGKRCESAFYELEEIAWELSRLIEQREVDSGRLRHLQTQLELIRRMEKKFSCSVDELMNIREDLEVEQRVLNSIDERLKEISREHKRLLSEYRLAARELTENRKKLAERFEEAMLRELKDLGMTQTRFEVHFREKTDDKPKMPSAHGDDDVEFLISPNPGEPLKPLAEIASGGELSRIMLAIKTLEADRSGVQTMVFDEIDTGISGRMAQVVAEKMEILSGKRQIICVTHLPQIAAAADHEYLVVKNTENGRTRTSVQELDENGRTAEISRMISGADGVNPDAEAYARRMLQAAEKYRSGRLEKNKALYLQESRMK